MMVGLKFYGYTGTNELSASCLLGSFEPQAGYGLLIIRTLSSHPWALFGCSRQPKVLIISKPHPPSSTLSGASGIWHQVCLALYKGPEPRRSGYLPGFKGFGQIESSLQVHPQ